MNQSIKISLAKARDAEILARLGRETFHDAFADNPLMPQADLRLYLDSAFTISQITSELNDPKTIFLLAEIDAEMVGYAKLERGAAADGVTAKNPIKLKRLYSKQKFIGAGIGKSLMQRCLDESAKFAHDKIWLSVWKHNLLAQNFYLKWDFKECGEYEFALGKTKFLDKLMARSIIK